MKNCRIFLMTLLCALSFKSSGAQSDGETWVPVFTDPPADYLSETMVGGDKLWYTSGIKTFGVISLLTNTIVNISTFGSFADEGILPGIMAANDDSAIFALQGKFLTYHHGRFGSIDSSGTIQDLKVAADGTISYKLENKVVQFYGSKWDTVNIDIPYEEFGESYDDFIQDSSGTLWVSTRWADGYNLYRIKEGTNAIKITRNESSAFKLLKDHQGHLRIRNDNTIVTVNNDHIDTLLNLNNPNDPSFWTAFDAQGNIWYIEIALEGDKNNHLVKRSMAAPASIKRYELPVQRGYSLYNRGIIATNSQGYFTMSFEDETWNYVSFRSLTGNSCGETNLTDMLSAHYYFEPGGAFFAAYNNFVSYYSTSHCYDLPIAPTTINSITKKNDGTIYIGTVNGLYHLESSMWVPEPSLKGVNIRQIITDKNQELWGIAGSLVFRQRGDYWQQIIANETNNLSDYTCSSIGTDSSGTIWLHKYNSIFSTRDGDHWVRYDNQSSTMPANEIKTMCITSKGVVYALWTGTVEAATEFILSSFNGNVWSTPDTIPLPSHPTYKFKNYLSPYVFVDADGGLWAMLSPAFRLCKYQDDTWTVYDSTNAPFDAAVIVGESREGVLYAFSGKNKSSSLIKIVNRSAVLNDYGSFTNTAPFTIRSIAAKKCAFTCLVQKPGAVDLSLITPQGRFVTTLFSEMRHPGVFTTTVPVHVAPGMYIAQLKTVEGSHIAPVLFR